VAATHVTAGAKEVENPLHYGVAHSWDVLSQNLTALSGTSRIPPCYRLRTGRSIIVGIGRRSFVFQEVFGIHWR
jgi:hypothetical protein